MKSIQTILLILAFTGALAQEQNTDKVGSVDINNLPEYVVIRFVSPPGVIIVVDKKDSPYESGLIELNELLEDRKKISVRNLTDLLNALSDVGFDYVDAFRIGDDVTGVVFRKKPEYRQEDD